ncbi:Kinesin- protein 12 [Homalodisca vitripennis]|nr:Kinesin- protein 12 [Homalodisca vitripennis]
MKSVKLPTPVTVHEYVMGQSLRECVRRYANDRRSVPRLAIDRQSHIFLCFVIDLLNPGTARKPLAVRWSKKCGGFFVENLFTVDCEELDDLLAVLEEGMRNRSVGSHSMNEHSSRSHTILTVNITSEQQV